MRISSPGCSSSTSTAEEALASNEWTNGASMTYVQPKLWFLCTMNGRDGSKVNPWLNLQALWGWRGRDETKSERTDWKNVLAEAYGVASTMNRACLPVIHPPMHPSSLLPYAAGCTRQWASIIWPLSCTAWSDLQTVQPWPDCTGCVLNFFVKRRGGCWATPECRWKSIGFQALEACTMAYQSSMSMRPSNEYCSVKSKGNNVGFPMCQGKVSVFEPTVSLRILLVLWIRYKHCPKLFQCPILHVSLTNSGSRDWISHEYTRHLVYFSNRNHFSHEQLRKCH